MGMEFAEVREYQPGDDVRTIDWNVTARAGRPFVKRFEEERELTVILAVDLSASGRFGSRDRLKNQLAAELCAVVAMSATRNNDKVGLLVFTDRVELFLPARKGSRHVLRVIREVLGFEPQGRGTDLDAALRHLSRILKKRAVVFVVSDFLDSGYERSIALLARRHDVVAVRVSDPFERALPERSAGLVEVQDPETGARAVIDLAGKRARRLFAAAALERSATLLRELRRAGVDLIDVSTDRPYVQTLIDFFRMRERRRA
jgi:uncharacterized protein (DUF58 family)